MGLKTCTEWEILDSKIAQNRRLWIEYMHRIDQEIQCVHRIEDQAIKEVDIIQVYEI